MAIGSRCADDECLEQIEFSSSVHLAFDELELGDLTLGLAVRPTRRDRGADRGFVLRDAVHECCTSDEGHDMLMRLYHTRYTEQIETADAATILARWE